MHRLDIKKADETFRKGSSDTVGGKALRCAAAVTLATALVPVGSFAAVGETLASDSASVVAASDSLQSTVDDIGQSGGSDVGSKPSNPDVDDVDSGGQENGAGSGEQQPSGPEVEQPKASFSMSKAPFFSQDGVDYYADNVEVTVSVAASSLDVEHTIVNGKKQEWKELPDQTGVWAAKVVFDEKSEVQEDGTLQLVVDVYDSDYNPYGEDADAVSFAYGKETASYWRGETEIAVPGTSLAVDADQPQVSIDLSGTTGANGYYRGESVTAKVTVHARQLSETASTVDGEVVQWNRDETQPDTWTFEKTYTEENKHTVSVHAETVRTRSADGTNSFTLDKTAPALSITVEPNAGTNKYGDESVYYNGPVTATVRVSDANLPGETPVVKDNGQVLGEGQVAWTREGNTIVGTVELSAEGEHALSASVSDKAGNSSAAEYGKFTIDATNPVVTGFIDVLHSDFRFMPQGTADDYKAFIKTLGAVTLKVEDANFDEAATVVSGGSGSASWQAGQDGAYTMTLPYGQSQNNKLSVTAADKAGHATSYAFGEADKTFANNGDGGAVAVSNPFSDFTFDTQKPQVAIEVSGAKVAGSINNGTTDVLSSMPQVTLRVSDVNLNLQDDATAVTVNGKTYTFKGANGLSAVKNGTTYDIAIPADDLVYGDASTVNTITATFVDWAGNAVRYSYGQASVDECNTVIKGEDGSSAPLQGSGFIVDGAAPAVSIQLDGSYVRSDKDAQGTDYFKGAAATATISVTDQNIESADAAAGQLSVESDGVLGQWVKSDTADESGNYTWTNTVEFAEGQNHDVSVTATDLAGWSTQYEYGAMQAGGRPGPIASDVSTTWANGESEQQLKGSSFTIDNTKPTISVQFDGGYVRSNDGVDYFNADTTATVYVTDWNFNADDTNATVLVDGAQQALAWVKQNAASGEVPVWAAEVKFTEGMNHTIDLTAVDWASHESAAFHYGAGQTAVMKDGELVELKGSSFTIDKTAPEVSFTVDQAWKNTLRGADGTGNDYFSNIDSGAKQLIATITVKDRNFNEAYEQTDAYPVTTVRTEKGLQAVTWEKSERDADGNVTWTCTILFAEGDGHTLSVKAVDWAQNVTENVYGQRSVDAQGRNLDGATFAVDLTAPKVDSAGLGKNATNQYTPGGNAEGDNGYWFYGDQSAMTINVSDNIALEAVWLGNTDGNYYVANPEQFQVGNKQATIQVALADGREFDRAIILHTRDMAKNERTWSISPTGTVRDVTGSDETDESLDKTNRYPQSVIQDTVSPQLSFSGVEAGAYYNTTQAVTLAVNELNFRYLKSFDAGQQVITVNKAEGNASRAESSWSVPVAQIGAVNDGADGLYSYTETFAEDGHYSLSAQVIDPALHSGTAHQAEFTIDKTAPTISVEFDNNDVRNGKYYNAARTATITVVEHNFDAGLMTIETNGSASGWTDNGDTHTATVAFTSDGTYNLSISGADRAGNAMQTYTADEFVVDLTAPTITFGGVDDKAAYNSEVMPSIMFSDEANFDASGTSYTVTGTKNGEVTRAATEESVEQGKTINFADFDHDADVDDIYTIQATVTDLAGNTSEAASITFSVNRFGSNYRVVDSGAYSQNNGYLNQSRDVQVEEINVSGCEQDAHDVTVTAGARVNNLSRNDTPQSRGYSVSEATSEDSSSNGWSVYTYTVASGNFDSDGRYHVAVSSNDRATNRNTSSSYYDRSAKATSQAEVSFILDKTRPEITELNVEENGLYDTDAYEVGFKVVENIGLDHVVVELDGDEVTPEVDGYGNYRFTVEKAANQPHQLSIRAIDLAGNGDKPEDLVSVNGWRVTTDIIELHLPWVIAGVIVTVLVAAGVTYGVIRFRKRNSDKDETNGEPSVA